MAFLKHLFVQVRSHFGSSDNIHGPQALYCELFIQSHLPFATMGSQCCGARTKLDDSCDKMVNAADAACVAPDCSTRAKLDVSCDKMVNAADAACVPPDCSTRTKLDVSCDKKASAADAADVSCDTKVNEVDAACVAFDWPLDRRQKDGCIAEFGLAIVEIDNKKPHRSTAKINAFKRAVESSSTQNPQARLAAFRARRGSI